MSSLLRFLVVAVLVLAMQMVSAQQTIIEGHVVDTAGLPVPDIKVLAYKAGTRIIVAYDATDLQGVYRMVVEPTADSLDIATSSLFFERKTKRVVNCSQVVDFAICEEVQQLKGVTVKAKPVEQQGDTVTYFVETFVHQQDKSIEDVLKRMPGIEVEDNGKILYQGAPIQKFYVEGMDLMEGNYTAVSKNLPHQSVSSVEVYENHQPIKMLQDKVISDQASINIKLSKNVALTGSAKVGAGVALSEEMPVLWNANITPMLFSGKVQMLAAYRTNNMGDPLYMYNDNFYAEDDALTSSTKAELGIRMATDPLFNPQRYADNRTHLINLNVLAPVSENTQVRVNLYYFNDLEKQQASQKNTLFLATDTLYYTEVIGNVERGNRLSGTLSFDRNDKDFLLNNKTRFSRQWDKAFGNVVNNGTAVEQNLQAPAFSIDNDLRIMFPIGERLLDIASKIGYGDVPHALEVQPGQFADFLNDSMPYCRVRQNLRAQQFFADHSVGMCFSAGRFVFRPRVGFFVADCNADAQLRLIDGDTERISEVAPDATVHRRNMRPYLSVGVQYKIGRFALSVDLPLALQSALVESDNAKGDQLTRLFFSPSLNSNYKLDGHWDFNASVRWTQHIENYESWMSTYLLADYQDLVMRQAPLSVSQRIAGSLGAKYKHAIIGLNADLRYGVGYTHSEMTYSYQVGEGGTTRLSIAPMPNSGIFQMVNGGISKYFSVMRATLALKGNLVERRGLALVNGKQMMTQSVSCSLAPRVTVKVAEWLSVDYSLSYNQIRYRANGQLRSNIGYWRHFGKAFISVKPYRIIGVMVEYYNHEGSHNVFVDCNYEFSLKKPKLDFELRWNNVFNCKQYVSYFTGPINVQETMFQLRPMELTVSTRFRF
ncbi:MAG: hypothetical protein HUK16_03480 [Bacteroidales bacterium]|nr:hypothetical protein [Bacteroidales bacterium]